MKERLKKLLSYKTVIFYAAACLLLFVAICIQIFSHYSNADINAAQALKNNQRLVINTERIIFEKKETEDTAKKALLEKAATLPPNSSEISVIVTNLGATKDEMEAAYHLPHEFGISFSPYTVDLYEQSQTAASFGHQVMLDLPLEVAGKDMGKFEITTKNSQFRNLHNLEAIFSKPKNVRAVVVPVSENFTTSDGFRTILDYLAEKKIALVYFGSNQAKVGTAAATANVKLVSPARHISDITKLQDLENYAAEMGFAIGIVEATPENLKALDEWQKTLVGKKLRLVPPINE